MTLEIWKPVVDFEELYEVSDLGNVKRVKAAPGGRVGVNLKPWINNHGYLYLSLRKNGRYKTVAVHVLVAAAFIDKRPDKNDVNHIDGVKVNNVLSNLEYLTRSQNVLHAFEIGLKQRPFGLKNGRAKLNPDDFLKIRQLSTTMKHGDIGALFGVSQSTISRFLRGETWLS